MLFTDSDLIGEADLLRIDNEAPLIAGTAKPPIVIEGTGSVCEAAWSESGQSILGAMQLYAPYFVPWGMSGSQVSAVLNTGLARSQPRVRLNQIVGHDWNYSSILSAVQQWLAYRALAFFYRDAAARLGQDRFEQKFERYEKEAGRRWKNLRVSGLPVVYLPLEAPGAKHGFNAGEWDAATNLTQVSAPGAAGGTFSIAVTYLDASKYISQSNKGNAESAPSATLSAQVSAANALQVSIASLNPPNGTMDATGTAQGIWTPLNATHWNLWVGDADGPLYLQQEKIPIATKTWALTGDPTLSGTVVGNGQYPDTQLVFQNIAMRG